MRDPDLKRQTDKAYRESHKEELTAYFREFREKNKATLKAKRAARYQANKEKILLDQKEYRAANKDIIKARKDAYRSENPEKVAKWAAAKMARYVPRLKYGHQARAARKSGLLTYFTGKPCRNGHIAPRYSNKSTCVECKREGRLVYLGLNRDEINARKMQYERTDRRIASRKASYAASPKKQRDAVRRSKLWQSLNPERRKEIARECAKRSSKKLSNAYICSKLRQQFGVVVQDIPLDLIEVKRAHLRATRIIKDRT